MSGYKHTLEVVLRAEFVDLDEEVDHGRFLPKFKGKGRVRIVEISSGKFREWSGPDGRESQRVITTLCGV